MNRIPAIDPTHATGQTAELLGAVKAKFGLVPNLMRTFAQSPAVLESYLGFSGALGKTSLPAAVREQIALATAESNGCEYCLAAHSLMGKGAGLSPVDIESARRGLAADPKVAAQLQFAREVIASRGKVSDAALADVRAAGAKEAEIVETVAVTVLNILTNYTNSVARTKVDFPPAKPLAAIAA